jgi:putative MATE family efflux protein
MIKSEQLGKDKIGPLLIKQSIPSAAGMLVLSIYNIVDTIFVGRYIGSLGIAGVTVVMPITYLISSIGMAIGMGGGSVISRALGAKKNAKANNAFGNMIGMTLTFAIFFVIIGYQFAEYILLAFGGKGDILQYALEYFMIMLIGVPFLAWAMMANNVIRAEGKPQFAMLVMIIPAISNIILDALFIGVFGWGIQGAAWATTISYMLSAVYAIYFFVRGKTEMRLSAKDFKINVSLSWEILSLGGVTLTRQGTASILILVLNQTLYSYGGELQIAVHGIVSRMLMFCLFPVMGLVQGFIPIAGYNYGAQNFDRVRDTINTAIKYTALVSTIIFICIMVGAGQMVTVFSKETELTSAASVALRIVFLVTPLIAFQLIGSAYFQAAGKVIPALILTLTKQGLFLIPLVLIMPKFLDLDGVWYSFPIADLLSTMVTWWFLRKEINQNLRQEYSPS